MVMALGRLAFLRLALARFGCGCVALRPETYRRFTRIERFEWHNILFGPPAKMSKAVSILMGGDKVKGVL